LHPELTVFIVDDDPAVRDALSLLLGVRGYRTAVFSNAEDFLGALQANWVGCLLIDIRMPGMDGMALQQKLAEMQCRLPVIIITGHGDVALARQAFKANAVDFLEKPFDHDKLIEAINSALQLQEAVLSEKQKREATQQLLLALTQREREVMELVVAGKHNREIGPMLAISVRTVEVHKARLMAKLGVANVAELVRITMRS
jgi:RNA polymerase sigma factor (sigma-70 family)